jgi:hypothetical protein
VNSDLVFTSDRHSGQPFCAVARPPGGSGQATGGRPVHADYSPAGGWLQFTVPLTAAVGHDYLVTVTNYGTLQAVIDQGTWQVVR